MFKWTCFLAAAMIVKKFHYHVWSLWFQAMATPREVLLKKVPVPMPTPSIFNLDLIEAFSVDTVVSKNGMTHYSRILYLHWFSFRWKSFIFYDFTPLFLNIHLPSQFYGFPALTFEDLGFTPCKLKGYPVEFLISYRKGGPQYGSTVSEKVTPQPWS